MNSKYKRVGCLAAVFSLLCVVSAAAAPKARKILVVTVTKGFRHTSIPTAEKVIGQLGEESKSFTVDYARTDEELAAKMTAQALAGYDGVIFASTTGDLPLPDREAFLNWIKAGHAFIGMHAATDTFHGYPPYIEMINGEFQAHGPQVKVNTLNRDPKHPAMKSWGPAREVYDEIYVFKSHDQTKTHQLMTLDKNPNQKDPGYNQPGYFPLAWARQYGKGRVFYTALGHREDVLESDYFKAHLLGGIRWALGEAKYSLPAGDAKQMTRK